MTENPTRAISDEAARLAAVGAHDAFFRTERYDGQGKLDPPKAEELWDAVGHAALTAALPALLPSREAVAEALRVHRTRYAYERGSECTCGVSVFSLGLGGNSDLPLHRQHVADAILALVNPPDQPCLGDGICTNPHCPKHGLRPT